MRRIIQMLTILISLSISQSIHSQESNIYFAGYIKALQSVTLPGNSDSINSSNLLHNRLNLKVNLNPKFVCRLEIRNRIFYGDQLRVIPNLGNLIDQNDDLLKLSKLWLNNRSMVIHSIIDRMQIQYLNKNLDIQIGRQRINWGIHNFWNPNDLFNTFDFLDFDFEERPGSDAIRIQYFSDGGSSIEAAFKPGKNSDQHTAGLLYKINKSGYDFQFLGGLYKKELVFGGGWAGGIKNTGWKSEFSIFIPYNNSKDTTKVFVFSTMLDQTFPGEWYVSLSALIQSSFVESNQMMNSFSGAELSAKNLYPSKFSILGSISKSFSAILSANLTILYATNRNVLILFPTFSWNTSENLQIDLTTQSFFSYITNSYGPLAHSFYLRTKWSF